MTTWAQGQVPVDVQGKHQLCLLAGHVPAGTEPTSDDAAIVSAQSKQAPPGAHPLPAGTLELQAGATPSPTRLPAGSNHLPADFAPDSEPALPAEGNDCLPSSPAAVAAPNPLALLPLQPSQASEIATAGGASLSLPASVVPAGADAGTAASIGNCSVPATPWQGAVSGTSLSLWCLPDCHCDTITRMCTSQSLWCHFTLLHRSMLDTPSCSRLSVCCSSLLLA